MTFSSMKRAIMIFSSMKKKDTESVVRYDRRERFENGR
jgi:hypothetical protein